MNKILQSFCDGFSNYSTKALYKILIKVKPKSYGLANVIMLFFFISYSKNDADWISGASKKYLGKTSCCSVFDYAIRISKCQHLYGVACSFVLLNCGKKIMKKKKHFIMTSFQDVNY